MGALLTVIVGIGTTVSGFSSEVPSGVDPKEQIVIEFEQTPFPSWSRRSGTRTSLPRLNSGRALTSWRPVRRGLTRAAQRETHPTAQTMRISPREVLPIRDMSATAATVGVKRTEQPSSFGGGKLGHITGPHPQDASHTGSAEATEDREAPADHNAQQVPATRHFQPPERTGGWNYVLHGR